MVAKQSAFLDGTNGPSQECPTVAAQSRSFSEKSCRGRVDAEGGCSRLQRQPQNRRQVGGPPPTGSHGAVAGPLFTPTAKSQDDFRLVASSGHRAAAPVSRILRRAHLSRWRDLHPRPPVVRYEHPHPGDLLHLDIKGLPQYQQVSMRGDGRRRGLTQHPGRKALHVAIDDHSRIAFSQLLPDQKAETTMGFLRDAVAFYAERGIIVRALLTDNGSSYRSHRFRAACLQLGLQHRRTRPYTPRTNGKAERFIQTALREWVYAKHWENSDQRDALLSNWLDYYNHYRPHGSLGYAPPISRATAGTTS